MNASRFALNGSEIEQVMRMDEAIFSKADRS